MRNKNTLIMILSVLIGTLLIGATFTSAIADFASLSSAMEKIEEGNIECTLCAADDCSRNCIDAIYFAVDYAWEHADAFPVIDWSHSYPIIKFTSDITIWAACFALELRNGFEESCYQPLYIFIEAAMGATSYAVQSVINMLDEILFIFAPAIFTVAFIIAVINYLITLCYSVNGDIQSSSNSIIMQFFSQSLPQYENNLQNFIQQI